MSLTIDDWIRRDAISFSLDPSDALHTAIDKLISSLNPAVKLLGFGEAIHGGEEILQLRNRLFQRLVTAHGYCAIALESSFPRGVIVNEYIAGRGPASYDDVKDSGFSNAFGLVEANRELIEWMRAYNADPANTTKLHFYGFDIPGLTGGIASPSQTLRFAADYLTTIDSKAGQAHRQQFDTHLGTDADWENPAMYADPSKSVGLSPAANALRIATEDLITELQMRRPELVAASGRDKYLEALQHATTGRQLLNFHAAMARNAGHPALLGIRDALIADNLIQIAERERMRGKVLVFAHNGHLQRGKISFPRLGEWWPAGAQLHDMIGPRYAVLGSAICTSDENGIGAPEAGSLEARFQSHLDDASAEALFIRTRRCRDLSATEIETIPKRSGSARNPTYQPLSPQSLTDFDWLAVLRSTTYTRGQRPLPS